MSRRPKTGMPDGAGDVTTRPGPARIIDVASLAGVSPGTASKAMNNTGQLRDDTRRRVLEAAERLGFTPDTRGRALSSGRSYTVGLLTTDSTGRFSIPIMLGAENALSAGELSLLLCDTRGDQVREQHYLRTLLARRVDGIIVTGRRTEPRPAIRVDVPLVYAFSASDDPADASVIVDDAAGGVQVADHLLALGRQRIAHVTGPDRHRSASVRAEAIAQRLGDHLVLPPAYGDWSERWGRHATDLVLRRDDRIDAISCGSDQIARGVCDRLRELGRIVPDEVAVTGFDNWDVMALACRPPLTTVDLELESVGRRAAQMLLDAIGGAADHGIETQMPQLVLRASTIGE